ITVVLHPHLTEAIITAAVAVPEVVPALQVAAVGVVLVHPVAVAEEVLQVLADNTIFKKLLA
ncbi:MAG TPA: hypothetical protein PKL91_07430, partial [Bacteroidales bacterium]|nr:hypothetical protein [Bacteroidales bacterium]